MEPEMHLQKPSETPEHLCVCLVTWLEDDYEVDLWCYLKQVENIIRVCVWSDSLSSSIIIIINKWCSALTIIDYYYYTELNSQI